MNVQLHSTEKMVTLNGIPARIWEGITESGIEVHAYITRIAIKETESEEAKTQFASELKQCAKPSKQIEAIPSRLVI
jgi:hypothetical protein